MKAPKSGVWLVGTEVGEYQEAGMQAFFTVLDTGNLFALLHCWQGFRYSRVTGASEGGTPALHPNRMEPSVTSTPFSSEIDKYLAIEGFL